MRDIHAGEELNFDYAMCDGSNYDEFECYCGSENCRGQGQGHRLVAARTYGRNMTATICRIWQDASKRSKPGSRDLHKQQNKNGLQEK